MKLVEKRYVGSKSTLAGDQGAVLQTHYRAANEFLLHSLLLSAPVDDGKNFPVQRAKSCAGGTISG